MKTYVQASRDQGQRWRKTIRSWLEANVPDEQLPDPEHGVVLPGHYEWERRLYEAGYSAIHWPVEHGGLGANLLTRTIFQEEYERVGAPPRLNLQGITLAGPTLMMHGSPSQCERWLGPILRSEEIWCQGFSEPDAGSDLASLRTTADIVGDEFIVNGQKIWTSGAGHSDWIFALVRTDKSLPRHGGISWLMIDLSSPGIEVRPIRQMNGRKGFSEVFFSDVHVPIDHVVGQVNDGWRVAMTALGLERGVGRRTFVKFLRDLDQLVSFQRQRGMADDPVVVEGVGRLLRMVMVYRDHVNRTVLESEEGIAGPEASYNKLYWSEMQTQIFDLGMQVLGPVAELDDSSAGIEGVREWQDTYWFSHATRIFAGTNQIQKNIIAERVLGLPKEPR